jgi:small subunit ribosomal protein S2
VDTNCDPDEADYIVPGNDDAIRACNLIAKVIADGIAAGQQKVRPGEFAGNGGKAAAPEPEAPAEPAAEPETVPEGDYEQVSQGEEPVSTDAGEQAPE